MINKLKRVLAVGIFFTMIWGTGIAAQAEEKTYETEPNSTIETAELMEATSQSATEAQKGNTSNQHPKSGTVSINDNDWFRVYLNAGIQYVTINGEMGTTFKIEVFNPNQNLILSKSSTKTEFGGQAYEFTASSSGYYYVKIAGTTSVLSRYTLMVGGPIYTVNHCSVLLEGIVMSSKKDNFSSFSIKDNGVLPKGALVYSISITGVSSYNIDGITAKNKSTSNRFTLGNYNLSADGLVGLKMPVTSEWEFTFGYKKNVTIWPTIKFYYVYPMTSVYAKDNITISPQR